MNFSIINEKSNTVEGFAFIRRAEKDNGKGSSFLDMILADKDGQINAKIWDYNEKVQGVFEINTIVKVRGSISVYNGDDQLKIEK